MTKCEVETYWFVGCLELPWRFADRIWFDSLWEWVLGEDLESHQEGGP